MERMRGGGNLQAYVRVPQCEGPLARPMRSRNVDYVPQQTQRAPLCRSVCMNGNLLMCSLCTYGRLEACLLMCQIGVATLEALCLRTVSWRFSGIAKPKHSAELETIVSIFRHLFERCRVSGSKVEGIRETSRH